MKWIPSVSKAIKNTSSMYKKIKQSETKSLEPSAPTRCARHKSKKGLIDWYYVEHETNTNTIIGKQTNGKERDGGRLYSLVFTPDKT